MTTIAFFNHTRKLFANGEVDLTQLKFMLVDSDYAFDATETDINDAAAAEEVANGGWDVGGIPIANAALTVVNVNEAMLDADNISETAVGEAIGPAAGGVIYVDDSSQAPLFHVDFEGDETAGEGTPFNVNWHENGIARWLVPA
jgi:hypothetical protein